VGVPFFSAAGAPVAFVEVPFSFAGAAFSFAGAAGLAGWAGATVVAGAAGAGFCCAVATATKATNVSKPTIRTILFILCHLLFDVFAERNSKRSAKIRFDSISSNYLILLNKICSQKDQCGQQCCKKLHDFILRF
jgi:hypothetical protein